MEKGTLSLVATPIGNLEDVTLRCLRILQEVDVVAAEDTRRTGILLSRHGIRAKALMSFNDHNARQRIPHLLDALRVGKSVAVVSDAGTPGINDPAFVLVREAIAEGIPVSPIPGPSAVIAALVCSGLPTDRFRFLGFLPKKKGQRRRLLEEMAGVDDTVVCFESPHRISSTLEMLAEAMPAHSVVIARELTKMHEEFLRGTAAELAGALRGKQLRGELVILFRKKKGKVD